MAKIAISKEKAKVSQTRHHGHIQSFLHERYVEYPRINRCLIFLGSWTLGQKKFSQDSSKAPVDGYGRLLGFSVKLCNSTSKVMLITRGNIHNHDETGTRIYCKLKIKRLEMLDAKTTLDKVPRLTKTVAANLRTSFLSILMIFHMPFW